VIEEMNEQMYWPFSAEEVKMALDSIGDLKALGPDGLPSIFYKKCWDLVGNKTLFLLFFFTNNFCIAPCLFFATKL
jgi:hypothetical protein